MMRVLSDDRSGTLNDPVPIEWRFPGPGAGIPADSPPVGRDLCGIVAGQAASGSGGGHVS